MPRIKKLIVEKVLTDEEMNLLKGQFIDESYMKYPVVQKNIDVYYIDEEGNEKLLLKYRKNALSDNDIKLGWNCYKDLAKPSRGRGASAGPIDSENTYWKKRNVINTKKWSTGYYKNDGTVSKMKVNNQVASNPVGFYESSTNFCKLPCRLTHFTRTNYDDYQNGLPFIQRINHMFEKL